MLSTPRYLRSSCFLCVCPFVFNQGLMENSICLAVQRKTMFFCACLSQKRIKISVKNAKLGRGGGVGRAEVAEEI